MHVIEQHFQTTGFDKNVSQLAILVKLFMPRNENQMDNT